MDAVTGDPLAAIRNQWRTEALERCERTRKEGFAKGFAEGLAAGEQRTGAQEDDGLGGARESEAQHWQTVLRRVDRLESELLAERAARQQLERQLRRTAAEFEAVAQRCERASQVAAAAEDTAQRLAGASQVEYRERWAAVEARLQVRGDTF